MKQMNQRLPLSRDKLIKILFVYAMALAASIVASAEPAPHHSGAESAPAEPLTGR